MGTWFFFSALASQFAKELNSINSLLILSQNWIEFHTRIKRIDLFQFFTLVLMHYNNSLVSIDNTQMFVYYLCSFLINKLNFTCKSSYNIYGMGAVSKSFYIQHLDWIVSSWSLLIYKTGNFSWSKEAFCIQHTKHVECRSPP